MLILAISSYNIIGFTILDVMLLSQGISCDHQESYSHSQSTHTPHTTEVGEVQDLVQSSSASPSEEQTLEALMHKLVEHTQQEMAKMQEHTQQEMAKLHEAVQALSQVIQKSIQR